MAAKDRDFLNRVGVTHVVPCIARPQLHFEDELHYHVMPVRDSLEQDMSPFRDEALQYIDDAVQAGGIVLIHCGMGASRAGYLSCACAMRRLGIGYDMALQLVRAARFTVSPNASFQKQLRQYEAARAAG